MRSEIESATWTGADGDLITVPRWLRRPLGISVGFIVASPVILLALVHCGLERLASCADTICDQRWVAFLLRNAYRCCDWGDEE